MSEMAAPREHKIDYVSGSLLMVLDYKPKPDEIPAMARINATLFNSATVGAAFMMLELLEDLTSEHPRLNEAQAPIEIAADHPMGTIEGKLVLSAHLCPFGVSLIQQAFEQGLPDLIDFELSVRRSYGPPPITHMMHRLVGGMIPTGFMLH